MTVKQVNRSRWSAALVMAGVFLAFCLQATPGFAKSAFELTLNDVTRDYDDVTTMIDDLHGAKIITFIPTYSDPTDPLNGLIGFRGLPINVTSSAGSTDLVIDIPATGLHKVFSGQTRDDSLELLKDWLKSEQNGEVRKFLQKLAADTPIDPIAGNPTSLMSRMVATNFDSAFLRPTSLLQGKDEAAAGKDGKVHNINLAMLEARYGVYDQDTFKVQSYTLPLSYAISTGDDPRSRLTIDFPLTWVKVENSSSYSGSLGLSYAIPLKPFWVVTPQVSYGALFSKELGAVGQILSGSATSALSFSLGDYMLNIGDMIGYYSTMPVSGGDFSVDPQIHETVFRNGAMVNIPTPFIYQNTSVEVFAIDTRFAGSALYNQYFDDFGFSYGFTKKAQLDLRLGLTITTAKDSTGYTFNLGYIF